jgi:AcrR family transcriptional regulator
MAEVCAERGYANGSVADVVQRAGVSTATFYEQFGDKRECMLAAHRELSERLLDEVDRACEAGRGWKAKVRAAIHVALSLLAADPPSARLLTVEIMAAGPAGAERWDAAIEAFASRLRAGGEVAGDPLLPHAGWAAVASMCMLVGKRVMAGEADRLPELEDELVAMATGGEFPSSVA